MVGSPRLSSLSSRSACDFEGTFGTQVGAPPRHTGEVCHKKSNLSPLTLSITVVMRGRSLKGEKASHARLFETVPNQGRLRSKTAAACSPISVDHYQLTNNIGGVSTPGEDCSLISTHTPFWFRNCHRNHPPLCAKVRRLGKN